MIRVSLLITREPYQEKKTKGLPGNLDYEILNSKLTGSTNLLSISSGGGRNAAHLNARCEFTNKQARVLAVGFRV